MPPKSKGKGKAPSASKEKKEPPRPTRCGPSFQWKPRPALVEAVDKNDVDRVKRLVARGEDPNQALHHAIGRGKLQAAQALLAAGATIHAPVQEGDYWIPPAAPAAGVDKPSKKGKSAKGKKKKKK